MPTHITTNEAKTLALNGSDSYRTTHLVYLDERHRDFAVVRLNLEALKAFFDTIAVRHRHQLAAERVADKLFLGAGGMTAGLELPPATATWATLEYMNYEHLKIASGFELNLKARLLAAGHVLHEIDLSSPLYKTLAKEQRERPILITELLNLSEFHFDGSQNYLPGLKSSSLKFSLLTEVTKYRAALSLPAQQIDIIDDYRNLRNEIHFPGDALSAPNIDAYPAPMADFLIDFINNNIVQQSNDLSEKWGFNFKKLVKFV